MKTYKLKIPLSSIAVDERKDKYFHWQWSVIDYVVTLFAEDIRKELGFSYNDYYEELDDLGYAFWFYQDSIEYFVYVRYLQDTDEFVEFEMKFGTFEIKESWFSSRRYESKKFYQKLEETVLKTIEQNNAVFFETKTQ